MRQRLFPLTAGERQGVSARVLAPQRRLSSIGAVLRLWVPTIGIASTRFLVIGLFVAIERGVGSVSLFGASLFWGFNVADDGLAVSLNIDLADRNLLWTTPAFSRFD